MKIISVISTRPNFMKIAPIFKELEGIPDLEHKICFTGQHYDKELTDYFFSDLKIIADLESSADYLIDKKINVTDSASKGKEFIRIKSKLNREEKLGEIFKSFISYLIRERPDLVLIPGDVDSSLLCAIAAKKLNIKIAHIESGLRSFDNKMPEEINRILIDKISDYLFITEKSGVVNLAREMIDLDKTFFTGNTMIDSLKIALKHTDDNYVTFYNLKKKKYFLTTIHRPSNVDDIISLYNIIQTLNKLSEIQKIIMPLHPRSKKAIEKFGLIDLIDKNKIDIIPPVGYLEFISLMKYSSMIITDSGGVQEEASYMRIPCITLRENTERPATVIEGTNYLCWKDENEDSEPLSIKAFKLANDILSGKLEKGGSNIDGWDGKASSRIKEILIDLESFKKKNNIQEEI